MRYRQHSQELTTAVATYNKIKQDQLTFQQSGPTGLWVTKKEKGKVAKRMRWDSWREEGRAGVAQDQDIVYIYKIVKE